MYRTWGYSYPRGYLGARLGYPYGAYAVPYYGWGYPGYGYPGSFWGYPGWGYYGSGGLL